MKIAKNKPLTMTRFKRETTAVMKKLKRTGRAHAIIMNGKPALVVMDVNAYKAFVERFNQLDLLDSVRTLKESIAEAESGHVQDAREAIEEIVAEVRAERAARKKEQQSKLKSVR